MSPVSYKRPLMISAVLIAVLVVGGWFVDVMVSLMACMLAILWQILCLLYYAVRWNITGLKLTGVRFLMWMAAALGTGAMLGHYSDQARAKGDALVAALQAHREREGRYPEQLEALVPRDIAVISTVAVNPVREGKFRYRSNGKSFTLMYITGFRMGAVYDSEAAKWEVLD